MKKVFLRAGKIKKYILLTFLPVVNFFISQTVLRGNGPYHLGPNFDPAYVYLLNALNIAHRITPGHYDHPGTPVQIFGAVIGLIKFGSRVILKRADTFYLDVLRFPEAYLTWLNLVMNLLLMFTLLAGGLIIYRLSGKMVHAVLFQLTPLLFHTTLKATTQFTPEPFLLIVVLWLAVLLYCQIMVGAQNPSKGTWIALSAGILVGLGIAIKVTFLPLVLLFLFFLDIKKIVISLVSAITSGLIFTLPIVSQYIKFIDWIKNLLIHSGIYGGGTRGLPGIHQLTQNTVQLFFSEPVFFMLIFLSIAINICLFLKRGAWQIDKKWILYLSILNGVFLTQTAVTIKHPPVHYMLAAMGLSCLLFFVLLEMASFGNSGNNSLLANGVVVLWVLSGLFFSIKSTKNDMDIKNQYLSENLQISQIIQSDYADCQIADYYRSSTLGYALSFGNDFVGDRFSDPLQKIYPDTLVYEKWEKNLHRFGDVLSAAELNGILDESCLLLRGSPIMGDSFFPEAMAVSPIYLGRYAALYAIDSLQLSE